MDHARFHSGLTLDEFLDTASAQDRDVLNDGLRSSQILVREKLTQTLPVSSPLYLYAAAEPWCIDTKVNLPVAAALTKMVGNVTLRCHTREASTDLGVERIPTFILYNSQFREIGRWVERPQAVREAMAKAASREEKLLTWNPYIAGAFRAHTLAELLDLLNRAAGASDS